jgi:transposase
VDTSEPKCVVNAVSDGRLPQVGLRSNIKAPKRTHQQADSAEQMWSMYMQLNEAEASFRALKSELSIRPLFHQKESRVKARIMVVVFLGYAMPCG